MSLQANGLSLYKGQSKTYVLTILDEAGEPQLLTGATVYFTVKTKPEDPNAIISKTSAQVTQVEILAQSGITKGQAKIYLVPSDTANQTPKSYVFDIWVKLADGKRYPVVPASTFIVKQPVTNNII